MLIAQLDDSRWLRHLFAERDRVNDANWCKSLSSELQFRIYVRHVIKSGDWKCEFPPERTPSPFASNLGHTTKVVEKGKESLPCFPSARLKDLTHAACWHHRETVLIIPRRQGKPNEPFHLRHKTHRRRCSVSSVNTTTRNNLDSWAQRAER